VCREPIDGEPCRCYDCGDEVCTGCLAGGSNQVDVSPYFKSGNDLSVCLFGADSVSQALRKWARGLRNAVVQIERLGAALEGTGIRTLDCVADTHVVSIPLDDDATAAVRRSGVLPKYGCVSLNDLCGDCEG